MKVKVIDAILLCLGLCSFVECLRQRGWNAAYENDDLFRRILYGESADVQDLSFVVRLNILDDTCTGSIIVNGWVLTAGHCLYHLPCIEVQVYPSAWQDPTLFVKPINCIVHPQFSVRWAHADLALLELPPNFQQDRLTGRIRLPPSNLGVRTGVSAIVAGYGFAEDRMYPKFLLQTTARVEPFDVCNKLYQDRNLEVDPLWKVEDLPESIFCTLGTGYKPSAPCQGDSGGPVIIDNLLEGVVSFVEYEYNVCKASSPAYHTRVFDYLPWIYSHIDPGNREL